MFRRVLALPPHERALAARAWWWLVLVRLSMVVMPAGSVRRLVARASRARRRRAMGDAGSAVRRAAQFVPRSTCLSEAYAAKILLGRDGHVSAVRIGVRRTGGTLEAHAWLEWNGRVLAGFGPGAYTPLPDLGA